ncbi:MAG: hypothetical protein EOO10_09415 [Chitinophagaceae bacterium]|nr:MAG: hypothetical protein EOO10_09415 [Chitinophagaceae bacterium]
MKTLSLLGVCCAISTIATAQSYKVQQCVIENGTIRTVASDYDPATGHYSISVNGYKKSFDDIYPTITKDYAGNESWFKNSEPVLLNGVSYVKYGFPRILQTTDVVKKFLYKGIGVYVEQGITGTPEVIYIPTMRGCEFQPYQQHLPGIERKRIYYSEDWKVSGAGTAKYYRLMKVNASGVPVGPVTDYYINGKKQWQGSLSYVDPNDNNKDVMEGVCVWFHPNGTKSEEVFYLKGKQNGVYRSWADDGSLVQEIEYKNGVMHGYVKTYSTEGKLLTTEHYTNGKLDVK